MKKLYIAEGLTLLNAVCNCTVNYLFITDRPVRIFHRQRSPLFHDPKLVRVGLDKVDCLKQARQSGFVKITLNSKELCRVAPRITFMLATMYDSSVVDFNGVARMRKLFL